MSIHNEHRQRVKERYEQYGLDSFFEHEVLEMLLFYIIARKDTNPVAHRLIDRFGSLDKVFSAPISELEKVEGVGHSTALYLKTLHDLEKYRAVHRLSNVEIVSSIQECGNYMLPFYKDCKVEKAYILCLDAKGQVLNCREVAEGTMNATNISVRKIAEIALAEGAAAVVLAHNHPTGVA
ncbi:MAG: RadC family protein, partial [Oscillospiraceae bacterium]|nr:RadC family protein [Oscillospiraceae bacterium]